MNLRKLFWPILVILITLPTVTSLLRPGIFQMHDDISVMRLMEMQKCFADGQIPCRWIPDMGFGYGYPQFEYYGPLPYYIQVVFNSLGLDLYSAVKLGFALALILGNIAMFYLGATFFGPFGGLVSAIAYGFVPYRSSDVYSRGAMGESWAFVFMPLILLCLTRFIRYGTRRALLFFSLAYAGLLATHNISTLIFTPLATIWGAVLLKLELPKPILIKRIISLVFAGLLAVCLSGFFFLPVIFETKLAHTESLLSGYFNYLAHYVSIKQLFGTSFWAYGSSEIGFTDDLSFSFGFVHLIVGASALLVAIYSLILDRKSKISWMIITSFVLFLGSTFLVHEKSTFIWKLIPFLVYLQFPWRFLTAANFFLAFMAGYLVYNLIPSYKLYLSIALVILFFLFNLSYFRPNIWYDQTPLEKFSGLSWEKQQTVSIFDYLPIAAKFPPAAPAPLYPVSISGGPLSILDFKNGSNSQSFKTKSLQSAVLQLNLFDWPTWRVTVDGKEVVNKPTGDLSLVTIDLPSGEHQVEAKLTDTPIRTIGNLLTLFSIPIVLFALLRSKSDEN